MLPCFLAASLYKTVQSESTMSYRWKADERDFAMPIRAGAHGNWQIIEPTTSWKTMPAPVKSDEFEVASDLYGSWHVQVVYWPLHPRLLPVVMVWPVAYIVARTYVGRWGGQSTSS
jgi:hypothetical protein